MKKKSTLLYFLLLLSTAGFCQTWNGSVSTDWNTATNWTPNTVPVAASNVAIPGSLPRYPKLANDVTINNINMSAGSQLDFNGFILNVATTVDNYNYFIGATLNNSNANTDIVLNINTGNGGYQTYFRSNVVNDNITFNLIGTNQFNEADAGVGNIYNGNTSININGTLPFYLSYASASNFNGNLLINRSVSGGSSLFNSGAAITGNFSFINNTSGGSTLGINAIATTIGGTVNIAANYTANSVFAMYRLINQTTGGTISVQNSTGFDIQKDTLKVTSLSVTGYKGGAYGYFLNNVVIGNVTVSDDPSYGGGYSTYIRNNVITGNTNFANNGTNVFYEADVANAANTYNGNTTISAASTGVLQVSYGSASNFNGNLTVSRPGAGPSQFFNAGAVITGNFSYTNNTTGASTLGNTGIATTIGGTVNITAMDTLNSSFTIYHLINQTTGGTINIQNTTGFDIQKDTLKVTSLSVTGYKGSAYGYFNNNAITGNVTIADDASYSGGYNTQIYSNTITGNSSFTNNGTNILYESDVANTANTYNGNTIFIATNSGTLYISYGSGSTFNGNLTINRTAAGTTSAFNAGATITGNFAYTNNTSGASGFGNTGIKTSIGGTVNIAANYTTNNTFTIYRLINQTSGGAINIQNTTAFDIQKDTLKVTSLSVTGYKGNSYAYLLNNSITGNVMIADDAGFGNGYYTAIYNNVITGNSSFTNNGTNILYESDVANTANTYNGNTSFTGTNSGGLIVSYGSGSNFNGNLTINRTSTGTTSAFNAGATIAGNFAYTNNTSGASGFGNTGIKTSIGGTINITASYTTNSTFTIYRLINQTAGGTINIQNTTAFDFRNDTLKVNSISVTGYRGNTYAYLLNNFITGNVTIADDASFGNGYYTAIYNNIITGNSSFTNNGSNTMYDADVANTSNKYIGNVTYARNGTGPLTVAAGSIDEITQNLTLNSASGISLYKIKLNGPTDGIVDQLGSQPITINELTIEKSGLGKVTLNKPLTISNTATFNRGAIFTAVAKELIFNDGTVAANANDSSYVSGPVLKFGNQAFTFPLGSVNKYAPLTITAPTNTTDEFRGNYIFDNPALNTFDTSLHDGTLHHVNDNEYWICDRLVGTSNVKVTLGWDSLRTGTIDNLPQLRVARWNGSTWKDEGNGGTTGNNVVGSVITAAAVTSFSPFTLASTTANNPFILTITWQGIFSNSWQGNTNWNVAKVPGLGNNVIINNASAKFQPKLFSNVTINNMNMTAGRLDLNGLTLTANGVVNLQGDSLLAGKMIASDFADIKNMKITGKVTLQKTNATSNETWFGNNKVINDSLVVIWAGGTLTMANTTSDNILSSLKIIANGGTVNVGKTDLTLPDLSLNATGAGNINVGGPGNLFISGNLQTSNSGTGNITQTTGSLITFNGIDTASYTGTGTMPVIKNIVMNKIGGIKFLSPLTVLNNITFTRGIIKTDLTNVLTLPAGATVATPTDSSYVDGAVTKIGNTAFDFPVGQIGKYAPISMTAPAVITDAFRGFYSHTNATTSGYPTTNHDPSLYLVTGIEYWLLDRTIGTSNVKVTLSYDSIRSGKVFTMPDLRVARWNGSTWKDEGNGGTTGTNKTGTVQTQNAITSFSPFTLATRTNQNPLPLTLVDFNAVANAGAVVCKWQTSQEINTSHFIIQRGVDGRQFDNVGSKNAAGNSSVSLSYQFDDINAAMLGYNKLFYRLQIVNSDGTFSYSSVSVVNLRSKVLFTVSPNPASDFIRIQGINLVQAEVITNSGATVLKKSFTGTSDNSINVAQLSKGLYIVRMTDKSGEVQNERIVIQ